MINLKALLSHKSVKYSALIVSLLLYLYYIWPFFNNVVFDAIIHFAYAETFIKGIPFQYNLHENVTASTSPFWTMLLIFFISIAGFKFIILLKIFILLLFISTSSLIYFIGRDIWEQKGIPLFMILIVWLITVSVIKNSFGGMENILSAFQMVLIYYLLFSKKKPLHISKIIFFGLIAGWALLTRPETGMICLGLILVYIIKDSFYNKLTIINSSLRILLLLSLALVILLPWYLYQFKMTGSIISDSAISRTYLGKWFSIVVIRGLLYLHPELLFIFGSVFLPFTVGIGYEFSNYLHRFDSFRKRIEFIFSENLYKTSAIAIILTGFIFYSIIVGGVQTGRYFLPYYPFVFIMGISGLHGLFLDFKKKNKWIS